MRIDMVAQNGWRSRPLGSLAKFINGRAFKPEEWGDDGVPIIRIQNLTDPNAEMNHFAGRLDTKHAIDDGDLLVSWSASLDAFMWERGPAALNQHIFKVEENSELVERRFLYYALRAAMDTIRSQIHGSTMQHITKPKFEAVEVRVPDEIDDQREVVGQLKSRLADVDAMRVAINIGVQAASELTAALIDEAFAPHRADLGTLGEVLTRPAKAGWSPVCDNDPAGTPVLTLTSVTGFRFRPEAVKYTSEPVDRTASYWVKEGDLFITRSNTPELVGHAAVATGLTDPTIYPDLLLRLDLNRDRVVPEFAHLWLMGATARRYVRTEAVGSSGTMKKINQGIVAKLPFPTDLPLVVQRVLAADIGGRVKIALDTEVAAEEALGAADLLPSAILREVFSPVITEEAE